MTPHDEQWLVCEKRLVQDASGGSREAFADLYDAYVEPVYRFIYHKTFHRETARDLTQTVFLKAMEGLTRWRDAGHGFAPWLFTIARNSVTDHYRTHHPHASIEDVWDLSSGQDVALDEQNKERYEALHESLKELAPAQRELLTLRIWQDLSFAEISHLQGSTEAASRMAFHRLLKKLRERCPSLLILLLILRP